MRWLILILILSSLFLVGCSFEGNFEKEPVLEQYILLRAENNNSLEEPFEKAFAEKDYSNSR